MALEDPIARRTQAILPVTWDALLSDPRFGEGLLQTAIDTAKFTVTGEVVQFEGVYSLFVQDYIAKIAALEIIPGAIDFWMNHSIVEIAEGTNENVTYTDRAEMLRKLAEMLLKETRDHADEVAAILGFRFKSSKARPKVSSMDDAFLTPSHQEFPRPYAETEFS